MPELRHYFLQESRCNDATKLRSACWRESRSKEWREKVGEQQCCFGDRETFSCWITIIIAQRSFSERRDTLETAMLSIACKVAALIEFLPMKMQAFQFSQSRTFHK